MRASEVGDWEWVSARPGGGEAGIAELEVLGVGVDPEAAGGKCGDQEESGGGADARGGEDEEVVAERREFSAESTRGSRARGAGGGREERAVGVREASGKGGGRGGRERLKARVGPGGQGRGQSAGEGGQGDGKAGGVEEDLRERADVTERKREGRRRGERDRRRITFIFSYKRGGGRSGSARGRRQSGWGGGVDGWWRRIEKEEVGERKGGKGRTRAGRRVEGRSNVRTSKHNHHYYYARNW